MWEQRPLPAAAVRLGADVLFCPGYSGPVFSRVPVVVSIHDVSFWAHPEWFKSREGLRRRLTTWASAHRARLVLTLTAFSRDEIIRWLDVSPTTSAPSPPAPAATSIPRRCKDRRASASICSASRRRRRPECLASPTPRPGGGVSRLSSTVGSIFNRRHVDHLIRAFARVAPRLADARLVIVGENRTHPHQDLEALVRDLHVVDRVELRSYVTDDELLALYGQARAFAFLSTYEGFGLTPVEAIISGVPAVVYDSEVARETLSGLAHFVPAGDLDALARQLHAMLTAEPDPDQQSALARAARMRYPWARTAAATLAALEEAARP